MTKKILIITAMLASFAMLPTEGEAQQREFDPANIPKRDIGPPPQPQQPPQQQAQPPQQQAQPPQPQAQPPKPQPPKPQPQRPQQELRSKPPAADDAAAAQPVDEATRAAPKPRWSGARAQAQGGNARLSA
jgi:hypothetical protein